MICITLIAQTLSDTVILVFKLGIVVGLFILLKSLKVAVAFGQRRFWKRLLNSFSCLIFLEKLIIETTLSGDRICLRLLSWWWIVCILLETRRLTAH